MPKECGTLEYQALTGTGEKEQLYPRTVSMENKHSLFT